MEKSNINRFVQKYHLSGLVESVKWEVNDNTLSTSFISDDKSVLGNVSYTDFQYDDSELGIYDTSKLLKMMGVLDSDISFSIDDVSGKSVSVRMKDSSTSVNYMLADLSVIPSVPDLKKLPDFNIKINLDDKFISRFIGAKGALSDENNFTFVHKDGKSQIILGYSNINTNRILIDVDAEVENYLDPISFSATYLKEILVANKEATDAVLNISSSGLAHIHFSIGEYKSDYYLVEISS